MLHQLVVFLGVDWRRRGGRYVDIANILGRIWSGNTDSFPQEGK